MSFDRQRYNYGDWTQGRFSEAVTVTGPGKMIFLAGIGAEHEQNGEIQHLESVVEQCRYAYRKLANVLERHGASLDDVVKQTTYVTDVRFQREVGQCRTEAYSGFGLPAHTFVTVSQLAWPGMLVELDVIAMVPAR